MNISSDLFVLVVEEPGNFDFLTSTLLGTILSVIFLAVLLLSLNVLVGNRQRKEGAGSWRNLFGVSAKMALIQMLPMLVGLLLLPITATEIHVNVSLLICKIVVLIVVLCTSQYLLPPVRMKGTKEALQEYSEPAFLKRLAVMCEKLGIQVPVVRMLNSAGGAMGIQAFAGGLPAPSLVISDGVIHRLSEEEADAIVGHELGHIANGSLWWFPFAISLAWSIAVVCAVWFGFWASLLFGLAVQTGLSRIVSRHFEFDSDSKAALVSGYVSTVKALDKIHISSVVANKGWMSFLAYSVATHPSQEERLQALYERSPAEDRPEVNWSVTAARRRGWGAKIACLVWLGLLIGSLWIPRSDFGFFLRTILYLSMILTPSVLIHKAIRKDVKSELKRRQFKAKSKFNLYVFLITVVVMLLIFYVIDQVEPHLQDDPMGQMIWIIFGLPFVVAIVLLVWGVWRGSKSPQAKIRLAIHQRRWSDAVALGQEFVEKIKSDAPLRHDLNLAIWMTGEQEQAIASMQELRNEFPEFIHPWLIEALMHLEREDPGRALELIEDIREDLPGDVSVNGIAARCYRQQGQLDKMEEEAAAIAEIIPDSAAVSAFRCAIELDQDNLSSARELWQAADELAPGDAYITLLKTELLHQEGNREESLAAFASAKKLIEATPFAFLGAELKHVKNLVEPAVAKTHEASDAEIEDS